MMRKRWAKLALGATCVAALAVPAAGQAGGPGSKDGGGRTFYATDNQNNLVSFSANKPRKLDSSQQISGLPMGVTLRGIDFRPAVLRQPALVQVEPAVEHVLGPPGPPAAGRKLAAGGTTAGGAPITST